MAKRKQTATIKPQDPERQAVQPLTSTTANDPNVIYSINGPVVKLRRATNFSMLEMVYVGHRRLIGEVILMNASETTIQVYENTTGLRPGEPVYPTGSPFYATLGPGIISNIFDGIERPLRRMADETGAFLAIGAGAESLDAEKQFDVTVLVQAGETLSPGQIYATCPETALIEHRCMLSPLLSGEVITVKPSGRYRVHDTILTLKDLQGALHDITLCQTWPIRTPRPVAQRLPTNRPLITGQRVIDSVFPMAKGGTAAVPGGFGTGKTMTQHQIAKWCDADIIVYIGCGERGNEMTQVLQEFSELIDPHTQKALTDRTVLIANTSNMPVAAREASIYTGITLAEYYRDMGYHVAIMADSTSRWAEALREISGRLEEMPAEEGFPAYLPSRLSAFYERAGYMMTLNGREGSVSIIGAVSPQGADFSEPVTQNTKRFVRCFWGLDKALAYTRHYPAINWITSYSEYDDDFAAFYAEELGPDFISMKKRMTTILAEEFNLMEIVKLIGADVLPDDQKLIIEIAKIFRVGFLQQNAFHKDDTYVPLKKQRDMMKVILYLYDACEQLVARSIPLSNVLETGIFDRLIRMKYDVPNDQLERIGDYYTEIDTLIKQSDR